MQLCLAHIFRPKRITDSGACRYFHANLIDGSYLRLFVFPIMVINGLPSGIKKGLGIFDHDFSWVSQRHIIPFRIFLYFNIGYQFAMEMGVVGIFCYRNRFFWSQSTGSSSEADILSALLHYLLYS